MKIKHYDLFAGIGGFSLALERVFSDATIEHIFCEWEAFPTAVLKKHWPEGTFYGDIWNLIDDLEATQNVKNSGVNGMETRPENTGTATTGKTPRFSSHLQENVPKQDVYENVSLFSDITDGPVLAVENRSDNSSLSTIYETMAILNERRLARQERITALSKQDTPTLTRHSVTTATSQKEFTDNAHTTATDTNTKHTTKEGREQKLTILTGGFPCQPK